MGFLDDVIDDLPTFFEDHGVDATWHAAVFKVLFHNEYEAMSLFGNAVEVQNPFMEAKSTDIAGMAHEDTVTIAGIAYKVKSIQPGDMGTMIVILSKD